MTRTPAETEARAERPRPPGGAAFRLEGATVSYPKVIALSGISLEIAAGEAVGFVGPSGSGKSTLLGLLNGTVRPADGRAFIDGDEVGSLSRGHLRRLRSSIGTVHQDLSLVPNLRVIQNVVAGRLGRLGFLASLRHMLFPPRDVQQEVHALLERVGIPEKLFERTDRLSGGQKQRVAIARALYQKPGALLADEPVASVDPARARDTVALLTRISREEQLTLCMSLHNLELAREFFPRLVGLRHGRVVFDRPAEAIGDHEWKQLYDLDSAEILADGA